MHERYPIPPYPPEDWVHIPAPVECGEELVDLAERMGYDLTPYIQEITSYF